MVLGKATVHWTRGGVGAATCGPWSPCRCLTLCVLTSVAESQEPAGAAGAGGESVCTLFIDYSQPDGVLYSTLMYLKFSYLFLSELLFGKKAIE